MICSECEEDKPRSEFYYKDKEKGTKRNWCKKCVSEYNKQHYQDNKEDYVRRARESKKKIIHENRKKLWRLLLELECCDCGEEDPIVLEFDHPPDSHKERGVATLVSSGYPWETVAEEIKKCDIVCANCHKKRTADRNDWWRVEGP